MTTSPEPKRPLAMSTRARDAANAIEDLGGLRWMSSSGVYARAMEFDRDPYYDGDTAWEIAQLVANGDKP